MIATNRRINVGKERNRVLSNRKKYHQEEKIKNFVADLFKSIDTIREEERESKKTWYDKLTDKLVGW